jgi:hypothetical protein
MKKFKRTIFFWTLVALFGIITPIVILNARGYRFDLNRGVFVYSGAITFKSNPRNVEVKLNGEPVKSKRINRINSSSNLSGLVPGAYDLEISAENFQTWKKKINIHSGIATEFWNVLLVRNDYERIDHKISGIDNFFTSPGNRFIAYTSSNDSGIKVGLWNISSEKTEKIFNFPNWNFIEDSKKENIEWSPDENFISVPVRKTEGSLEDEKENEKTTEYNYFIIDLEKNQSINLNRFLRNKKIKSLRWDPKEKGVLYFLSENSLYKINVRDISSLRKIFTEISAYDISHSEIYYSSVPNNLIFKKGFNESSQSIQITKSFPDDSENVFISKMIVYDDSKMALISNKNELYIYNDGEHATHFRKIGSDIKEVHFSNDGKKLLFWSNNEISVYHLRDWLSQPQRKENELQNITRYFEPIKNVGWFKNYEHIIFSSDRWVKIIEIDPRDKMNCMDVLGTNIQNPFLVYNNYFEKLYFIDEENGTKSLYSIVFPEKVPFLGIGGL